MLKLLVDETFVYCLVYEKKKKIKVLNSLKLQCNETCKESVDKNTKERRKDIILNYARKFWIVLIYVYTGKTVVG